MVKQAKSKDGRALKLGRKRSHIKHPHLRLANYTRRKDALPTPPADCDYSSPAASALAEIYLNDQLGDCVIAGGYHIVATETGNAGSLFTARSDQILDDYRAIAGYRWGDPSTDNGCDEQSALAYWTSHGFANGTRLAGYLAVNPADQSEVQLAMWMFENLMLGIELPDKWIDPFQGAGFVWDVGSSNPQNGHCMIGIGCNEHGVQIDTWGMLGTITWAAIAELCIPNVGGELYVLLTPDQLAKGQAKAPNGLAWSDLLSDFAALGGTSAPTEAPDANPLTTRIDMARALADLIREDTDEAAGTLRPELDQYLLAISQ